MELAKTIQTSILCRLYPTRSYRRMGRRSWFYCRCDFTKLEDMSNMDAYLCGPPIMIETSCDALYKGGVKGTNISYDEF